MLDQVLDWHAMMAARASLPDLLVHTLVKFLIPDVHKDNIGATTPGKND